MKYLAKNTFLVIAIITIVIFFIFEVFGFIPSGPVRAGIAGGIAALLAPRRKKIQTQSGEKTQITWLFLKEPVFIDK